MITPVGRDALVDDARALVPNALWITVGTHRTVGRLPNVPLASRACVVALRELEPVRVRVGVNVHDLVIAKVDAVGTKRPRAAIEIRIEHLVRERDPPPG